MKPSFDDISEKELLKLTLAAIMELSDILQAQNILLKTKLGITVTDADRPDLREKIRLVAQRREQIGDGFAEAITEL
ncbi:MAG: hypothetical protein AABY93_08970 [Bacteroidota bacterium]